ncbi:hypothetical protein [Aureimonas sp. ME7]|uniref:hypothetical protein n=1 Tax=Aureimonas sp. ME7 TaxID=2744252 RepID=UPI0015F8AFFB|nr:hypothetical protein [Aureimonas sp. ME7]
MKAAQIIHRVLVVSGRLPTTTHNLSVVAPAAIVNEPKMRKTHALARSGRKGSISDRGTSLQTVAEAEKGVTTDQSAGRR